MESRKHHSLRHLCCCLWPLSGSVLSACVFAAEPEDISISRLGDGPIISPETYESIGNNIQGPSLIKVPNWVEEPLGAYYLYFADHRGDYIRMAYADAITGPWTVYAPGTLGLEDSYFPTTCPPCSQAPGSDAPVYAHIASPDVHVRHDLKKIVMYLHGRDDGRQLTRLALSNDGIHFVGDPTVLGRPYFRVIHHDNYYYALSMPGYLYRSRDGLSNFAAGPRFFSDAMRHSALLIHNGLLYVFFSRRGDAPEQILLATIELEGDWLDWQATEPVEVLRPEMEWEGANLPIRASKAGYTGVPVNQLRDPAIYQEAGETFLLYSAAGESGIAIAQIEFE